MTDTDLSDVPGIGPSRENTLESAGFETVADVASAEPEELGSVLGPSADPEAIIDEARNVADVEDEDTTDEDTDPRSVTRELHIDDRETALYVVKGLVDENLRLKKRNQYRDAEDVNAVIETLLASIDPDGGSVDVDLDDLSILYTAVRNIEQEFQGSRGITDLTGDIRAVREDVQSLRSELWPDSDD